MYLTSNLKKVLENETLTFRLICQDGKRAEVSLKPRFVRLTDESEPHRFGVHLDTRHLPPGVEFVMDYTTIAKDPNNPDAGVIVRGNHNECAIRFNGETFPLFKLESNNAGVELSVDEIQAALGLGEHGVALESLLESFQNKLREALSHCKTVPGKHGSLYFQAMPVEFGGGLIESYAAKPEYGFE